MVDFQTFNDTDSPENTNIADGLDPTIKATVTAANALKVDGSAVTQPVSGTVTANQGGTWTVQQGTPPWTVVGNVASGVADSGNPVKVGGVFNTVLPTLTTGQRGDIQLDSSARQIIAPLTNTSIVKVQLQDNAGAAITLGQKTMASSVPVVIASDQTAVPTSISEFVSINNSSTSNIAAAATFTGTADSTVNYGYIGVSFRADQAVTIQVQQSIDGTNWDHSQSYTVPASTGDQRSFRAIGTHTRVLVTNNGGSTTTIFRLKTIISPIGDDSSIGTNNSIAPTTSTLVGGKDTTNGNIIPLAVDTQGRLVTSAITGFGANFSFGDVTTAATTRVVIRRTAYTEQTTNAQRSLVSSSANDAAAGTGARTVLITYMDQTGAGPFTETITLNGTTPVNTVSTTICFIEKMEVVTAGSTGSNVGIITLRAATGGGGVVVGTIAATDRQTFWAHHYVPTGKTCNITGISCGHNGTTVGSGALFTINALTIGVANSIEKQISDFVRLYGQSSTFSRSYVSPVKFNGPARLQVYLTPETSTSIIYRAAIDFFEP